MAIDPTEDIRRALVPLMPAVAAAVVAASEPTWTTTELQRDFELLGFAAPLVIVRRRADGVKGSLEFTHSPRLYFNWQAD